VVRVTGMLRRSMDYALAAEKLTEIGEALVSVVDV
jgi:hypothetical protein